MIKNFRELEVWKKADALAHRIFDLSETFPRSYLFDLTTQLRRAALSSPTNLAEGSATTHTKELLQFINISRRSTSETQYLVEFAHRRTLLKTAERDDLISRESAIGPSAVHVITFAPDRCIRFLTVRLDTSTRVSTVLHGARVAIVSRTPAHARSSTHPAGQGLVAPTRFRLT